MSARTETLGASGDWTDAAGLVADGIVRSKHAAFRAVKRGDLPPPVVVAGRFIWNRPALNAWLLARTTPRPGTSP